MRPVCVCVCVCVWCVCFLMCICVRVLIYAYRQEFCANTISSVTCFQRDPCDLQTFPKAAKRTHLLFLQVCASETIFCLFRRHDRAANADLSVDESCSRLAALAASVEVLASLGP